MLNLNTEASMSANRSYRWIATSLISLTAIGGCGPERPKTIPITGQVTINGNAPGEVGNIYFTPTKTADGYSSRPAKGAFGPDGTYHVMSWAVDDGLVPGHYAVSVIPADPNKTAIPRRYHQNTSSGLEVDVPVDQRRVEYNIELRRQ
jgi:hypothetical protein